MHDVSDICNVRWNTGRDQVRLNEEAMHRKRHARLGQHIIAQTDAGGVARTITHARETSVDNYSYFIP